MSESGSRVANGSIGPATQFEPILERFGQLCVLVVGDVMLDDYRGGEVERISPEAPVPVMRVLSERTDLGGAGNVARALVALGATCDLVAAVGRDPEGDRIVDLLADHGIRDGGIVRTPGRPTPHKIRVVARGQQLVRIDREEDGPLAAEVTSAIRAAIERRLESADVVVLQDYDKGLFLDGLGSWVIERARRAGIRVVADPKQDLRRFHGAWLVKPNVEEACAFLPGSASSEGERRALLEKIQRELGGAEIVMTRGAEGMTALDAPIGTPGRVVDVPTRRAEIFDVQGAGDTAVAALALCRAAGASLVDACIVANAASAIVVAKQGTASANLAELRRQLPEALAAFEEGS